jgi:hypothetical protein
MTPSIMPCETPSALSTLGRLLPSFARALDLFANTGSDLYSPIGITFGPDNNLYVATQNAANVMRFNYPTGTFQGPARRQPI